MKTDLVDASLEVQDSGRVAPNLEDPEPSREATALDLKLRESALAELHGGIVEVSSAGMELGTTKRRADSTVS